MSVRYGLREILDSYTPEKRSSDGVWTRLVLRPLSFPAAWALLRAGISPNATTYLSAALCVVGFFFIVAGPTPAFYAGISLFFAFGVLDCADGNMARVLKKPGRWGEWVDALGGYVAYSTFLLGIGVAAEAASPGSVPGLGSLRLPWAGGWVLVGAAAAACNLLMRLVFQSYRAVKPEEGRASVGGEKRLSETIGITGFLVPVSAIGFASGFLPWVVAAYAAVYCGGCAAVVVKLVARVEAEVRGRGE